MGNDSGDGDCGGARSLWVVVAVGGDCGSGWSLWGAVAVVVIVVVGIMVSSGGGGGACGSGWSLRVAVAVEVIVVVGGHCG